MKTSRHFDLKTAASRAVCRRVCVPKRPKAAAPLAALTAAFVFCVGTAAQDTCGWVDPGFDDPDAVTIGGDTL